VVEKAALLDVLSGGRFILGMGRGSSDIEFEGFGISKEESRVRFDEAAEMVVQGLEQGYCEFDGALIKQKKVNFRPAPTRSFKGRRYGAATTPESCETVARLGLGMLINPQKPLEELKKDIALHDRIYRETHGEAPPPSITSLTVYCDENQERVDEVKQTWIRRQAENAARHYLGPAADFVTGHSESDRPLSETEHAVKMFIETLADLQIAGSPETCFEKLKEIHEVTGSQHFAGMFSFAGLPGNLAETSIRLFAREVLPEAQKLIRPIRFTPPTANA
jgi:alkanesulfonate monooxygenase SsuD/methylene tetrahydromethanopterin reductase-like flavin-dependent oxidoreductase (luciferase family)